MTGQRKTLQIYIAILDYFEEMKPRLTVRQIYYALTVRNIIEKTRNGYKQVCYHLRVMRKKGIIPYGWIADNTRYQLKPTTYKTLEDAINFWHQNYRRDLWAQQDTYVEIWVEKDALARVISPITMKYDVALMVVRGYSSETFLYECAEDIQNIGKETFIYHFGDHDPSGVNAAEKIEEGLVKHGADVHFERVAVTPHQIESLRLPTRETKRSDPRSKNWGHKPSVELDALPPQIFRDLVKDCIEQHIDTILFERTKRIEELEKETLKNIAI
jgi:hypothetical protein